MTENQTLTNFIQNWRRIHRQTVKLMQVAPDDKYDWKTCESAMTLGGLMNHFPQAEAGLAHAIAHDKMPSERPAPINNTAELIAAFDASHEAAVALVSTLGPERLSETITPFHPSRPMTREQLLYGMLEHEIHHRGQLYTYLRMLGAEVPPLFA
jgi:uncharacterized damage-inducible protein DinB